MSGNLDVVGRREGHDLRASTATDAADGLRRLYAADGHRRTRTRLTVVAVLLGALSAGLLGRGVLAREDGAPAHPTPVNQRSAVCHILGVECLPGQVLAFDLPDPVHWVFEWCCNVVTQGDPTATEVEVQDRDGRQGVLIAEQARPATPQGQPARGFGPSPSPGHFAEWLASRPYLDATSPRRTHLAGHAAWTVRARIAGGAAPGRALCGHLACYPLTFPRSPGTNADSGGAMHGMRGSMLVDLTFLSLPSGTAVVWSWTFDNDPVALDSNRGKLEGISWPDD